MLPFLGIVGHALAVHNSQCLFKEKMKQKRNKVGGEGSQYQDITVFEITRSTVIQNI